jgi:hypothetical protein
VWRLAAMASVVLKIVFVVIAVLVALCAGFYIW